MLRAVAILSVVLLHSFTFFTTYLSPAILRLLVIDGVTVFFVLSGFLIGTILIRELEGNRTWSGLKNFWIRRWLRTLPAYLFVFLITVVHWQLFNPKLEADLLPYLFFFQSNYGNSLWLFPESWSLCVEEWFYLLIPFVFWLAFKQKKCLRSCILVGLLFSILLITVLRAWYSYSVTDEGSFDNIIRKGLWTRLDSIMYGVLGAYIEYYHAWKKKKLWFFIGLLLFLIWKIDVSRSTFGVFRNYLSLPVLSLATLFVIPLLTTFDVGKGMIAKFITFTSTISYSIYLVHFTLFQRIAFPGLSRAGVTLHQSFALDMIAFVSYLLWAYGAGYLLYKFIETPFMNLRNTMSSNNNRNTLNHQEIAGLNSIK